MFLSRTVASDGRMTAVLYDDVLDGQAFSGKAFVDLADPFYRGKKASSEDMDMALTEAFSVFFIGKESVAKGRAAGLLDETTEILLAPGVPFAQMFRI